MTRNWHHEHVKGGIALGEQWSYTRRVVMINPTMRTYHEHAYVLWFGAYGWTRLHVYADSLEDALEECAAWLADYAPGLIVKTGSDEYQDLMREACVELELPWPPPKDADLDPYWEAEDSAMVDMTRTESGWIASWEWGIGLEDPTVPELYAYICGE